MVVDVSVGALLSASIRVRFRVSWRFDTKVKLEEGDSKVNVYRNLICFGDFGWLGIGQLVKKSSNSLV